MCSSDSNATAASWLVLDAAFALQSAGMLQLPGVFGEREDLLAEIRSGASSTPSMLRGTK